MPVSRSSPRVPGDGAPDNARARATGPWPTDEVKIGDQPDSSDSLLTLPDALARMSEAEDTLRALSAGEIDAFVVSRGGSGRQVFTLSTADRPYRMFVENMRDGAATLSGSGLVLYANRRLAELLSTPREQVVGVTLTKFLSGGDATALQLIHDQDSAGGTIEIDLLGSNGDHVPVLVGVSLLAVDDSRLTCLTFTDLSSQKAQDREIERLRIVQAERLSELQDAQAALTRQATHDALTGLPNRALLMDRIQQALVQARRSDRCTAVFFIDLDRFKQVNDSHGHAIGDAVLRAVGGQLASVLRSSDTVARIGGDEFIVLADQVDNELHAVDIGNRMVSQLQRHAHVNDNDEPITASVGIAVSVAGRGTAESLLNEADVAMYQAKSLGGARAEVFDAALGRLVTERSAARRMLQNALDDHRMVAFYQPIVEVESGAVAGFEALARIVQPDGEVIQPFAFIAVAEETGLIVPLGARVLSLGCHEAVHWPPGAAGCPALTVAVNLSARQFESGDLISLVEMQLDASGIAPHRLHLELTETATIDLRPEVLKQLGQLRDLGVEIGLDDFGTGYGSLTHLRRLPLTFVKIDRSFVTGLGAVPEDERIVSAVINLADNLGLRCIAEGVETVEQFDYLRNLGCHQAQGYLFARPLPAAGLDSFLAERSADRKPRS